MGTFTPPLVDIKNIEYQLERLEEDYIVIFFVFFVVICILWNKIVEIETGTRLGTTIGRSLGST